MADRQVGDGLYVKLGIDYSGMIGGAGAVSIALNQTLELFSKFEGMAQGFIDLANQAAEYTGTLDRLSITTGMTNDELQRFANVARYADSDVSSLAFMVNKLQLNLRDQGEQGEKARKVLDSMHVSYKNVDGSLRSAAALFPDVIEGLKGYSSSADRVTAANVLVGKGYQELAGYIALGKDGIERYFNTANTMTEEQQIKLRTYESACKDLDATLQNLNYTVGSQLAPSFALWASEIDKAFGDANAPASRAMDFFLQRVNEVLFTLEATAQWVALSADGTLTLDQKQQKWGEWVEEFKQSWAAMNDTPFDAYADAKKRYGIGSSSSSPSDFGSSSKTALDQYQIQKIQNALDDLTKYTIPKQQDEVKRLKKAYEDVGDKSSKAAKDAKLEWEHAQNTLNGYLIQQQEAISKLTQAGASASAASGGPTYNTAFASALNTGGAGPDWAGFSDLANMSAAELEEVAKGGLGKSKAEAERAQLYFSMISGSGAGDTGEKKADTLAGQAQNDTKTISSELDKQATAYESLTAGIEAGWVELEEKGLVHYAALAEMSRVRTQAELDYMAEAVNFAGANPIVQNKIIMSKDGPDWVPPAFVAVKAPTLKQADFSTVKFSGQGSGGAGAGTGGVKVEVNQTISGVDKDTTNKVTNATVTGVSKALMGVDYFGGAMI